MNLPTLDSPLIDAARAYLDLGLLPIPVHGVLEGGGCTCGNIECKAVGKHPVGAQWQKRAPRTLDDARDAFDGHRGNIGVCVASTPFVVLDFDGAPGLETLADLEASNVVPRTLRARSGGGGAHLFYRLAEWHDGAAISDRRVGPAWDVKKHGQVLAAPSIHASGNPYEWVDDAPIAVLPDILFDRIRRPVAIVPAPSPATVSGDLVARARAYVDRMPAAIAGAGGHNATFAVARKLVQDFGLGEGDAWSLLVEYNQRCEPPWTDRELRHKLASAMKAHTRSPIVDRPRRGGAALAVVRDDESEPAPPPPPGVTRVPDWKSKLLWAEVRGKQKLVTHAENVIRILSLHPSWRGRVRFDEFRGRVVVHEPPWDDYQRPTSCDGSWTDEDATRLHAWLRREFHVYAFAPSVTDCERAVDVVARSNGWHPVREYLGSLEWDGVPRLDRMGATYFGAADDAYTSNVCRWWMISAVARILSPGCKADHVLILEGKQGRGKSTALEILAGADWFNDTPIDLNSKDAYGAIRGKWIVELAELDSLFRAEASRAKAFFSSRIDTYRAAYARREKDQPRSCVFAGSVNEGVYLRDPTGARRFWPVRCERLDLAALRRDRDQLWAEAMSLYVDGARWWPEREETKELEAEQESRTERDEWESRIERYLLKAGDEVSGAEILEHALGLEPRDWTRQAQTRVGAVMQHGLRWSKHRKRDGEQRTWVYQRPNLEARLVQPNGGRLDQ